MRHFSACWALLAAALAGSGYAQALEAPLRFAQVLEMAAEKSRQEDARQQYAENHVKMLESLGKMRFELRPSAGLLAFSNPVLWAVSTGAGLFVNRGVSQPLLRNARFDALAAEFAQAAARTTAEIEAAHAYFALLRQQYLVQRTRERLESRKNQRARLQKMVHAAAATRLDTLSSDREALHLEWQQAEAEADRRIAAARLANAIGRADWGTDLQVAEVNASVDRELPSAEDLFRQALERRTEIGLLREKAEALWKAAPGRRRIRFHSAMLGGYWTGDSIDGLVANTTQGYYLGGGLARSALTLAIPLRDTGEALAEERMMEARLRLLDAEAQRLETRIREEIATARAHAEAAITLLDLAGRRLDLEKNFASALDARQRGGLEDGRALSDAGDRIAEAEKALAHALFERRASLFQLLAVVGAHREP